MPLKQGPAAMRAAGPFLLPAPISCPAGPGWYCPCRALCLFVDLSPLACRAFVRHWRPRG